MFDRDTVPEAHIALSHISLSVHEFPADELKPYTI